MDDQKVVSGSYDKTLKIWDINSGRCKLTLRYAYIKSVADPEGVQLSAPRGGGGTLIFSSYAGTDPAFTVYKKKISGISRTPKKYFKF